MILKLYVMYNPSSMILYLYIDICSTIHTTCGQSDVVRGSKLLPEATVADVAGLQAVAGSV